MTSYQALYVKYLRIKCKGTWRYIALEYSKRYNGGYCNYDLQEYGAILCDEAMKILNENIENGWN